MPWIFFLLALGCLALAMRTQSMGFALLLLCATLGFMLAGVLGLVSARIQSRAQGGMQLNPALERERLRQQRAGGGSAPTTTVGASSGGGSRRETDSDRSDSAADGGGADGGGGGGD